MNYRLISVLALTGFASSPAATLAGTLSFTGASGTCSVGSCNFGALTLPVNISFTDNLGLNNTGAPMMTTDDWLFSVPLASGGASVTGDQISLSSFTISGTVQSFALYSVGAGNVLTLVPGQTDLVSGFSGTLANGPLLLNPSITGGNYDLRVVSSLQAGAVGSYSGVLVAAAPVPLPVGGWLLLSGLGGLGALGRRRTVKPL